jgi:Ran GTPase-activating protein (RanGAP) involved in mRNA processing and transport
LNVRGCQKITDGGIKSLANALTTLEHLDVSDCPLIKDPGIALVLQRATKLKNLLVDGCFGIGDDALAHVGNAVSNGLLVLDLSHTSITDRTLLCIADASGKRVRLQHLILNGCALSERALVNLRMNRGIVSNLKRLEIADSARDVAHGSGVEFEQALRELLDVCGRLTHVNLSCLGDQVTFLSPAAVGEHSSMLASH